MIGSLCIFLVHIKITMINAKTVHGHFALPGSHDKQWEIHCMLILPLKHFTQWPHRSQWVERWVSTGGLHYIIYFPHFISPVGVFRIVVNKFPVICKYNEQAYYFPRFTSGCSLLGAACQSQWTTEPTYLPGSERRWSHTIQTHQNLILFLFSF